MKITWNLMAIFHMHSEQQQFWAIVAAASNCFYAKCKFTYSVIELSMPILDVTTAKRLMS